MLPVRNEYGMWPASGEIDIMESRGNLNYPASAGGGVESFGSTLVMDIFKLLVVYLCDIFIFIYLSIGVLIGHKIDT
jgi:hypothetical protein